MLNLLATPGLGSLLCGRWIAGTGQLLLSVAGFALVIVWFFKEMIPYYGLMFNDADAAIARPENARGGRNFVRRRVAVVGGDEFQFDARSVGGQSAFAGKFRRAAAAETGRRENFPRARLRAGLEIEGRR